ncbi:MAG: hypothetical protein LUD15_11030, partial [Bacteroides sp.]|nr:hypothetical protein [Bacteroides sp.]
GIYEKKQGSHKMTAGIRHRQSYTDNQYRGDTHADVSLKQAESYLYTEYQGRTGALGYMAGVTGVRLWHIQ